MKPFTFHSIFTFFRFVWNNIFYFFLSQDLEIYREQIRQHSLTIVGFENQISSVRQREAELLSQIDVLKKRIREIEREKEKETVKKITPPPTPPKIDSDLLMHEKTIENLR